MPGEKSKVLSAQNTFRRIYVQLNLFISIKLKVKRMVRAKDKETTLEDLRVFKMGITYIIKAKRFAEN